MNSHERIPPRGKSVPRFFRIAAAVLCAALLVPMQAHAGILDIFSSIVSVIQQNIGGALENIRAIQTQVQSLYTEVLWPVSAIKEAHSFVSRTIASDREWMNSVFTLPIASAQRNTPRQLESWLLSGNAAGYGGMSASYTATYGSLPAAQQALLSRRRIMDINDALAKDAIAQSMASDQANAQMLTLANQIETGAETAAPGTAPYLTASALTATLQTQAFQLQLMASLLREDAAQLALRNARRKQQIARINRMSQSLQQMLTVQP